MTAATAVPRTLVACLCAAWCGTCAGYRRVFDRAAGKFPGCDFVWIDIEDESDVLGDDLEIETFPTVLVARGDEVRFYGVLTPHPEALARIVRASLAAPQPGADPAARALLGRIQATRAGQCTS